MDSESESYDVHSKSTDMVRPINQGFERSLWTMFIITVIAVFAAALVVAGIIHGGAFYWPLMLFGAVVGSVLLRAPSLPHVPGRSIPRLRGRR